MIFSLKLLQKFSTNEKLGFSSLNLIGLYIKITEILLQAKTLAI